MDGLRHLDGDFALMLWDPSASTLTLARDGVGVRPLFFTHKPRRVFVFASLASILTESEVATCEPDREVALRCATGSFETGTKTFLRDVERVLPGHALIFDGVRAQQRRYWTLRPGETYPASVPAGDLAAELRHHLDRAVRKRLPVSGDVGTHLSGGLDSTAISVLAARAIRASDRKVRGFAILDKPRPDAPTISAAPLIQATVQAEPNLEAVEIDAIDTWRYASGNLSPFFPAQAGTADPYARIAEYAGASGITPILSGFGGDQLVSFSGQGDLAEYLVTLRWRKLFDELKARSERRERKPLSLLAGEISRYLLPSGVANPLRRLLGAPGLDRGLSDFLKAAARPALEGRKLGPNTVRNRLRLISSGTVSVETEFTALQAARHGTCYAYPFLDRTLLEFAIRLPTDVFCVRGVSRAIFREAMSDVLPESVRNSEASFGTSAYRTLEAAELRDDFLAAVGRLRRVDQIPFDLGAIEHAIHALPEADEWRENLRRHAEAGTHPGEAAFTFALPLLCARFLAGDGKQRHGSE